MKELTEKRLYKLTLRTPFTTAETAVEFDDVLLLTMAQIFEGATDEEGSGRKSTTNIRPAGSDSSAAALLIFNGVVPGATNKPYLRLRNVTTGAVLEDELVAPETAEISIED
jgi:hypothetical protein